MDGEWLSAQYVEGYLVFGLKSFCVQCNVWLRGFEPSAHSVCRLGQLAHFCVGSFDGVMAGRAVGA